MANKCTGFDTIYNDLPVCPGKKSMPGLKLKAYYISKRDLVLLAKLPAAPKTMAEAAVLDGEFKPAADKKFIFVGLVSNKSNIKTESQGEAGSKTFKNTVELALPGTEEEVTGLIAELNNDDGILVVQTRNGKFRVIGNEDFAINFTLAQDGGTAETDANQTTVTAEVTDYTPAPFYQGKLLTSEGTIDCKTGEMTSSE